MSERMIELQKAKMLESTNNNDGITNCNNANGTATTEMNSTSSSRNVNSHSKDTSATDATSNASKPPQQQQQQQQQLTSSNGVARTPKGKDISNYANAPPSMTATAATATSASKSTSLPPRFNPTAATATTVDSTTTEGNKSTTTPNQKSQGNSNSLNSPTSIMLNEDKKLRKFLTLLSMRQKLTSNNTHIQYPTGSDAANTTTTTTSIIGPTVPHSLSKRILNRQGVNYMDESITAIMSGAADRFLATVLQQSMICRHLRLQGEERAKKEKREIQKLKKRRREALREKQEKRLKLEQELEKAIPNATGMGKKSSTKKATSSVSIKLIQDVEKFINDDDGMDTLDEEMDYYEKQTKNEDNQDAGDDHDIEDDISDDDENDEDEEDENKLTLQLCDVVRPLDAWDISLTGKIGLSVSMMRQDNDEIENEALEDDDDSNSEEGDGDLDIDGDDEDDDISMATSKTGGKKIGKRIISPKPTKSSPSKAKLRKKDATPKNDSNPDTPSMKIT